MSVYSYFDRRIILPIAEKFYGSTICKEWKLYEQTDWMSEEQLIAFQNQRLQKLIRHCYENVPYYTKLFHKLGLVPSDIQCRDDLQKLPVLTKQMIRDNYNDLMSSDIGDRKVKYESTGGSTGTPLKFCSDNEAWSWLRASTCRAWGWYGFQWGEKIFTLGGHSLVKKGIRQNKLSPSKIYEKVIMRNFKYSGSGMTEQDMQIYYKAFMKLRPAAIRGYASSLSVFAEYVENHDLPIVPIKLILTTGEKLMPQYRAKLQKVFKAPVYDAYGAGDGGIVSHECYMHEGLHISEECCVIEITDRAGKVLPDGEIGFVTSTDLGNYSFPFIRYHVGDMSYIKKEKCSCGRSSRLFGEVLGRAGKLLYSKSGIPVSPTMLPIMLYKDLDYHDRDNQTIYNKIDRFQIRQDKLGDLCILLKLKDAKEIHSQFDYVVENFKRQFANSKVELQFVEKISTMSSGKEDYCISEYEYKK